MSRSVLLFSSFESLQVLLELLREHIPIFTRRYSFPLDTALESLNLSLRAATIMADEVRAYAKIVGPGWEYYMTQPKITLGRGGEGIDCDVIISSESAVSRQHFTIRFAPELQAFEVENLSKNGILVNGEFIQRLSPPVLLRSQADIAFGRLDPMRLSFLLPVGTKASVKKKELAADRNIPLMQWIGEAISIHTILNADEIRTKIDEAHPNQLQKLGSDRVIASSIRHILTQNDHVFHVVDSQELEQGKGPATVPLERGKVRDAYFGVREEHRSRFYSFVSQAELENHQKGMCLDPSCGEPKPPKPHNDIDIGADDRLP